MKTDFERRDKSSFETKKKFPSFPSLFHFQKSMIKDRSMDFSGEKSRIQRKNDFCENHRGQLAISVPSGHQQGSVAFESKKKKWKNEI